MIASRRRWHYRAWLVLTPLIIAGLIAAITLRDAFTHQESTSVSGAAP